jgi:osmotically-inducible protein OsmY
MTKTQDIRDAVELELSYDPLVDISGITVKNINGEVALNGTVPSFPQYLEAAAAARRCPFTGGVISAVAGYVCPPPVAHRPASRSR